MIFMELSDLNTDDFNYIIYLTGNLRELRCNERDVVHDTGSCHAEV